MMQVSKIFRRQTKFLLLLFLFSLLVRLTSFTFFFSRDKNYWNDDTIAYHGVAAQLSKSSGFTNEDGMPHFYRVPIYSIFLGICYKIFGQDIKKALLIQLIIACFIPILIFFLSLILFPTNLFLAKFSSILISVHLGFILYSCIAMTETLFMIFFLLYLISFFKFRFSYAGIFLGLASLTRPVGHYLILLSIVLIFLNQAKLLSKVKNSTAIFFSWLSVVSVWLLRNYLLTGYIFFHTLPGIHFLRYSAVPIIMKTQNLSYNQSWGKLLDEWKDKNEKMKQNLGRELFDVEKSNNAKNIAFSYCISNPVLSFRYAIFNMFKTCFALFSSELLYIDSGLPSHCFEHGWWSLFARFIFPKASTIWYQVIIYLEIIFMILLYIGFFLGTYQLYIERNYKFLLVMFAYIFLFVFITLASGFARVRLPIEPFLIIISSRYFLNFLTIKKNLDSTALKTGF